ncbi:hypothetical protein NG799_09095 [Laspinema sp. D1]|uniref:Uncharacterized protein n=1 Tax=Laspinema palackyanum D2a TaxID=2953684 RepID=A0ABT2MSG4_9CYAN|nr:hypothetical protein [Laspinema sp. D2a]
MFNRSLRQMVGVTLMSFPLLLSGGFYNSIEAQEYDSVEFTLVNGTNRVLEEFYVSHPSEEVWGNNILDFTLQPGEEATITINDGLPDCKYDLKVTLGPGNGVGRGQLEQTNVEICDDATYTYQ